MSSILTEGRVLLERYEIDNKAENADLFVLFSGMKMLLSVDSSVIQKTKITCDADKLQIGI